jgi:hypothetical protein
MYEHHIKDMAASLVEAGLATDHQQVQLVLAAYWADKVAVVWTTEDVHAAQEDFDENEQISSLSEEQAQSILQKAFEKHDANEGITSGELALLE